MFDSLVITHIKPMLYMMIPQFCFIIALSVDNNGPSGWKNLLSPYGPYLGIRNPKVSLVSCGFFCKKGPKSPWFSILSHGPIVYRVQNVCNPLRLACFLLKGTPVVEF